LTLEQLDAVVLVEYTHPAMRWYSSTVKRRVLRGMTILSILLGESGKCPASSSIEPKLRRTVIGTLQAGAVLSRRSFPLS